MFKVSTDSSLQIVDPFSSISVTLRCTGICLLYDHCPEPHTALPTYCYLQNKLPRQQRVWSVQCSNIGSRLDTFSLCFYPGLPKRWTLILQFLQWKPQQDATLYQNFINPYFKWSSTCFGRYTAHHQEPKTAQAASGFAYVEGCGTCSCWTLSGSVWEGAVRGKRLAGSFIAQKAHWGNTVKFVDRGKEQHWKTKP